MSVSEQTSASKREKFLARTSFKNVSGNYQFNGAITPERVFNIAADLFEEHPSPQQQPDKFDPHLVCGPKKRELKFLCRCRFCSDLFYGKNRLDNICKTCGTVNPKGQPDELSKAQERIAELESDRRFLNNLILDSGIDLTQDEVSRIKLMKP